MSAARFPRSARSFEQLYWWLRSLETEDELRVVVRELCARYGVDLSALCGELCMGWDEITELARDPLVTIGAHTVNHFMLKKTPERVVRGEMEMRRAVHRGRNREQAAASLLSGRR